MRAKALVAGCSRQECCRGGASRRSKEKTRRGAPTSSACRSWRRSTPASPTPCRQQQKRAEEAMTQARASSDKEQAAKQMAAANAMLNEGFISTLGGSIRGRARCARSWSTPPLRPSTPATRPAPRSPPKTRSGSCATSTTRSRPARTDADGGGRGAAQGRRRLPSASCEPRPRDRVGQGAQAGRDEGVGGDRSAGRVPAGPPSLRRGSAPIAGTSMMPPPRSAPSAARRGPIPTRRPRAATRRSSSRRRYDRASLSARTRS